MLEALLRAVLPTTPRSAEREDAIVNDALTLLERQGLPLIAASCTERWKSPAKDVVYAKARAHIASGVTRARDTEQRRITRRDAAVRSVGYVKR